MVKEWFLYGNEDLGCSQVCYNCALYNVTGASLFEPIDSYILNDVTKYFNVTKKFMWPLRTEMISKLPNADTLANIVSSHLEQARAMWWVWFYYMLSSLSFSFKASDGLFCVTSPLSPLIPMEHVPTPLFPSREPSLLGWGGHRKLE